MLSKRFKSAKCKTSLKLAVARIKLLKNKREVQLKQMKRDVAKLLESGQEQTARIRVEHVVREEKTMAAYDIVELYCQLLVARLPIIESQKNCPIDLKEPIASVIFASPRCADIPELLDVRKHLTKKYGKEFVTSALELRPDCGVNHTIIEKLSARTPDGETKIKILTAIAREHNVNWDPAAMEEQLMKPRDDLLTGPSKFVSASNIHLESPTIQVQPPPSQKDEPATKFYENDVTRSSETSRPVSATNGAPVSMPSTSFTDLGDSGSTTEGEEFRHSFSEDATSLNRQNWNMKFKDATSAAQAAAESAEMASVAARAAAELARHGKVTGEYSSEPHASSFHGPRKQGTRRSADQKFKDEYVQDDSASESGSPRSSHRLKPRIQNKERDETGQDLLFRAAERRYDDYGSTERSSRPVSSHTKSPFTDDNIALANHQKMNGFSQKTIAGVEPFDQNWQGKNYKGVSVEGDSFKKQSSRHTLSDSSMGSLDDEIFVVDQNTDNFCQKGFSEAESLNQNRQDTKTEVDDHRVGSIQEQSSDPALPNFHMRPIGNDDIWDLNVQSHDNGVNQFSINIGQQNTERGTEKPGLSDYPTAVFDESGSDCETHLDLESNTNRHHFDSYFPPQGESSSSHLSTRIEPLSVKQGRSESPRFRDGSRIFVESAETIADETVPSQSDELLTATFDDSDEMNSESEEEGDNFKLSERKKSSYSQGKQNVSSRTLSSPPSGHVPTVTFFNKKEEAKEENQNAWSHASSDDSDLDEIPSKSNQGATLNVVDGSWKRHDTGDLLSNRPSLRHARSPRNSSDLAHETSSSSIVENHQLLQPLRLPSVKEVTNKDKYNAHSTPPTTKDSELSYNLSGEDGIELNIRKLTGGLRNKGLSRRPYVRGHSANTLPPSTEGMANETPSVTDKPPILTSDRTSVSSEACDNELYGRKPNLVADKESSSNQKTYFDSDSDDAEVRPLQTGGSRGYRGVRLSRRTKDSSIPSVISSPSKFNGRSEVPASSDFGVESGFFKPSPAVGEPLPKLTNKSVMSENSIEQPYKLDAAVIGKSNISSSDKNLMYSEAHENRSNNQKPGLNSRRKLMSSPKTDSDSDDKDSEVMLSRQTAGSRGYRDAIRSHRTMDSPSQLEMDSLQKFSGRTKGPETLSKPPSQTVLSGRRQNSKPVQPDSSTERRSKFLPPTEISERKESMQPSQPSSFSEQPSKPPPRTVISGHDESQKSLNSSGGSTSRERSNKTASHVHPKLPDYDSLTAHLESIRSDRRSQ